MLHRTNRENSNYSTICTLNSQSGSPGKLDINFYSAVGETKEDMQAIGQALAALRRNSNEDNLNTLRRTCGRYPVLERKNSIMSVDGDVTELNKINLFESSYDKAKEEYLNFCIADAVVTKDHLEKYYKLNAPDLYEKEKNQPLIKSNILTNEDDDFTTKYKHRLETNEKKIRIIDEKVLYFYTNTGSDAINDFLEDKAANAPGYQEMSTEIKSAYELICSQLNNTLHFLRDNSENLKEIPELYRITVLSNKQITDIENQGFYQVNRFLSTSRGTAAIMHKRELIKYKKSGKNEKEVLLRIKNPSNVAVDVSRYAATISYLSEKEHIIPPGNKLQFIPGSRKRNGLFIEMSFNLVETQAG